MLPSRLLARKTCEAIPDHTSASHCAGDRRWPVGMLHFTVLSTLRDSRARLTLPAR